MSDTSSPPSSWYDPPEGHEVDGCDDCHKEGLHDDPKMFADECGKCEKRAIEIEEEERIYN